MGGWLDVGVRRSELRSLTYIHRVDVWAEGTPLNVAVVDDESCGIIIMVGGSQSLNIVVL